MSDLQRNSAPRPVLTKPDAIELLNEYLDDLAGAQDRDLVTEVFADRLVVLVAAGATQGFGVAAELYDTTPF